MRDIKEIIVYKVKEPKEVTPAIKAVKEAVPLPVTNQKGRHELKHEITKLDCYLLRNRLKHYMEADPHAGHNGKYLIRSVYFDNFENKILNQKKEGFYGRDKFRVRLYDNNTSFLNLEKKSKRNNMTYKQKCSLTADEYEKIRCGEINWMENDARTLMRELYFHMVWHQLKPLTVVDYEREVFVYPHGNVRITFDSDIKTSFRNNDVLNSEIAMVETNPDIVVLEIKYDEYLPSVIKQLLQIGDRRKGTYSKYQISRMYG